MSYHLGAPDGLKTDLYELTMAAGYFQNSVKLRAVFELFCYQMPPYRSYLIACGLEQALQYILNLGFSDNDVAFLKSLPAFKSVSAEFFDYLKGFKFTGDVWAMKEGEVFFASEPIIQIDSPIIEAQILETYLLSIIHIQSLVASKASRVVQNACSDGIKRGVIDFGSRRAHGPEAGILAARASYIAGCIGTSNMYAAKAFGIPVYGTMAHSWVEAFDTEEAAFLKYYDVFPGATSLLIDTYDTLGGAKRAVQLGSGIKAVRLDSGNLGTLSKKVRKILDAGNLNNVKIITSGSLNEYKILNLVRKKSPIDIFGVGTDLVTSRDSPSLDLVYKLVQTNDKRGNIKFKAKYSQGKETIPGRKQVFRKYGRDGLFSKDIIGLFSERPPGDARSLLKPVIQHGRLTEDLPGIETARRYTQKRILSLPSYCMDLYVNKPLKTEISQKFGKL